MNRYSLGAEGSRWWWTSAALGTAAAAAVAGILLVPEDSTDAAGPSRSDPSVSVFVPGPVNVENSTPTEGKPS
ncbi:MAG: hypothetical protein ACRDOM_08705 [Nocardioides sp.]